MAVVIPKGFFPVEDTGLLVINTEGPRGASFDGHGADAGPAVRDPAGSPSVANVVSNIGAGGRSISINQGRAFVELKERDGAAADQAGHPEPAAHASAHPGPAGLHQPPSRTSISAARITRTQYLYTLQGLRLDELYEWAQRLEKKLLDPAAVAGRQHRPADRCARRAGQRGPRPGHHARRLGRRCPAGAVLRLRQPADLHPLWPGQCLSR